MTADNPHSVNPSPNADSVAPNDCPEHDTYHSHRWIWRHVLPRRVEVLCCRRCSLAVALS
jgi:hypothetical protein